LPRRFALVSKPRRSAAELERQVDHQMREFFGDAPLSRGLDAFFPRSAPPVSREASPAPARPRVSPPAPPSPAAELREDLPEAFLAEAFRMVMDFVLPTLPLAAQVTYLWLFRYAYGFNRNHCRVSRPALMRVTGLSKRGLDLSLAGLERLEWIRTVEVSYRQGTLYQIYLPHERSEELSRSLISSQLLGSSLPLQPKRENINNINSLSNNRLETSQLPYSRIPSRHLSNNSSFSEQPPDSRLDQLLDKFYAGLNQRRISSMKRERGLTVLAHLLQDGYTIDEIAYAIDWTMASISGLHSIGILPEVMGQALAARERLLAGSGTQPSRQVVEESSARARAEAEQQQIEELKATFPPERLEVLREDARALVAEEYPNLKFGQDILIRLKVDELIRAQYLT
jgi:hypothetical protein